MRDIQKQSILNEKITFECFISIQTVSTHLRKGIYPVIPYTQSTVSDYEIGNEIKIEWEIDQTMIQQSKEGFTLKSESVKHKESQTEWS